MQSTKTRLKRAAWRDGWIIFGIAALVLTFFISIEAFTYVVHVSELHEDWELDEILTTLMILPFALAVFAWRRLKEAESELTGRIVAEHKAQQMALHDPLTGLPNRRHLKLDIDKALKTADTAPIALLLLDLNRFKAINDLLGHLAGDQLLIAVAERLVKVAGPNAVVSRLGGDEFVIMIRNAPQGEALVSRVAEISDAFTHPFILDTGPASSGASIGATYIDDPDLTSEIALTQADAAMYGCKAQGRNGFRFFEEGMEEAALHRAKIEAELSAAIAVDGIEPYYQPLIELDTGKIVGFEVLARWPMPDGTIRQPDDFIRIAEDTGLICDLFFSILRQAACAVRDWPPETYFAVNLSPVQFADDWLVERTLKILTEAGVAPGRLEIEITENALVEDVDLARGVIEAFKSQGIRVTLDDFGTGYSSLRHLSELKFDKLKIDRSFIHGLESSETSQTIVRTITTMAHNLGLQVTVEGVDSSTNADTLLGYGCDIGQGYLYGVPSRDTVARPMKDLAAKKPGRAA